MLSDLLRQELRLSSDAVGWLRVLSHRIEPTAQTFDLGHVLRSLNSWLRGKRPKTLAFGVVGSNHGARNHINHVYTAFPSVPFGAVFCVDVSPRGWLLSQPNRSPVDFDQPALRCHSFSTFVFMSQLYPKNIGHTHYQHDIDYFGLVQAASGKIAHYQLIAVTLAVWLWLVLRRQRKNSLRIFRAVR